MGLKVAEGSRCWEEVGFWKTEEVSWQGYSSVCWSWNRVSIVLPPANTLLPSLGRQINMRHGLYQMNHGLWNVVAAQR